MLVLIVTVLTHAPTITVLIVTVLMMAVIKLLLVSLSYTLVLIIVMSNFLAPIIFSILLLYVCREDLIWSLAMTNCLWC